jgi:hypothetical protein
VKKFSLAVLGTIALTLILALSVPALAQDDRPQHPDDRAAQEDKRQDQKQDDKDVQRDDKEERDKDRQEQEKREVRNDKDERQEKDVQRDEKTEHAGGRIPDDRFRAHFGREHVFVINRPVIVGGVPRFQYGGYWFAIAQPWPVGWAYTDQVYVDFIDGGYYLLSPVHPGVQVSINVVL